MVVPLKMSKEISQTMVSEIELMKVCYFLYSSLCCFEAKSFNFGKRVFVLRSKS